MGNDPGADRNDASVKYFVSGLLLDFGQQGRERFFLCGNNALAESLGALAEKSGKSFVNVFLNEYGYLLVMR